MVRLFCEEDESKSDTASSDIHPQISVFSVESVKCAAHSLQLAVKDYLDATSKDSLKRVRDLAKALRTSAYRGKTSDLNLAKVSIDLQTRWNSTYFMIKCLIPYKSLCLKNIDAPLYLSQSEWDNMETLLDLLEPGYIATKKLQEEQLFFGDFFKVWLEMKLVVDAKPNNSEFLEKLERRERILLQNPSLVAALYLDPRLHCIISKEPLKQNV